MSSVEDYADWQCENCNLYSPKTSGALFFWCETCEKIVCGLCTRKCLKRKHRPTIATEVISQLKSDVMVSGASMTKAVVDVQLSSVNAMRSIAALTDILRELKFRCEAINDVAKTIASAMKEHKERAAEWNRSTEGGAPFTSFFIKRVRAQVMAQKTIINEAVPLVVSLMQTVKGADEICADVRALLNSISTECQLDEERADVEIPERVIKAEQRRTNASQSTIIQHGQMHISVKGPNGGPAHPTESNNALSTTNSMSADEIA